MAGATRTKTPLLAAIVAVLLTLSAGCGDRVGPSASPSSTPVPFVGYWTGSAGPTGTLLAEIQRTDSIYRVGLDGLPPKSVSMADGRLVIQRAESPSETVRSLSLTSFEDLDLAWQNGRVVVLVISNGKTVMSINARRISEAEYRRRAAYTADQSMRFVTLALFTAVQRWQKRHAGSPPPEARMKAGSALADLVPGHQWPMSPYTWTPVHEGTQTGYFTYTTDGITFRLRGHLSGGKDIVAQ